MIALCSCFPVDVSYVGVDELNDISIIAYPNPTKENLIISSEKIMLSVQIFDIKSKSSGPRIKPASPIIIELSN